ncbi:TolC family protein [Pleomorphovibrio marinus]|uniref:TolC family protein n=1 Tax=Pleomorphovibrio marinus TaxID=2164132 RepID=UPI000E0B91DB|nr:TolC family protein [Pleomorphovibrio marinus]
MKLNQSLSLFALLFVLTSQLGFAQESVSMSLEESIQFALENNVDAKNAQLEVLASRGIVGERRSEGLPQISSVLEFTANIQPPLIILPAEAGGFFGGNGNGNGNGNGGAPPPSDVPSDITVLEFAVPYQSSLNTTVEQMIFNGSYFIGLKAARTLKDLTEFDKEKAELDVIEQIKKAYFTVLVNEERRGLIEGNQRRLEQLLKETEAMREAGFAEKLDVSRIRVQLNNVKTEIDRVNSSIMVSKELLKMNMGLPLEVDIFLSQRLNEFAGDELAFTDLISRDADPRVEVYQMEKNLELATLDLKNNQVQYIPTLNAFGTYQRVTGADELRNVYVHDRWFSTSFVGFRLNIPIFDGLRKSYAIQQNRVQIKQLENAMFATKQNIRFEEIQAKEDLRNSLRALEVQNENRQLAEEVFEMTRIKYQEGVGSNFEVVEADADLKEAETNYYSALYDALIAKVDLEKALGILK